MVVTVKEFVEDWVAYWLHEFVINDEVIRECQEWVIKEMDSISPRDWNVQIAEYSSKEQFAVQKLVVEKATQWWWYIKKNDDGEKSTRGFL